jgi:hypothetical protein
MSRSNTRLINSKEDVAKFFKSGDEMGCWNDNKQEFDVVWSCKFDSEIIILGKKLYWFGRNTDQIHMKGVDMHGVELFANDTGYQALVELSKNNVDNWNKKDGIDDRNVKLTFTFDALQRRKIQDQRKFDLLVADQWYNTVLTHKYDATKTIKFAQNLETRHVKPFEEYLQIFSSDLPPVYKNLSLIRTSLTV